MTEKDYLIGNDQDDTWALPILNYVAQRKKVTRKVCSECGIEKLQSEFPAMAARCKPCHNKNVRSLKHERGDTCSFAESKNCTLYLGVHIAEGILKNVFKQVVLMPFGNPGYDFICNKGLKIDVKSACIHYRREKEYWCFAINKNKIADYFLLLAFDNRQELKPLHLWLVPGNKLNTMGQLQVSKSRGIKRWIEYEQSIDKVIIECDTLRGVSNG